MELAGADDIIDLSTNHGAARFNAGDRARVIIQTGNNTYDESCGPGAMDS